MRYSFIPALLSVFGATTVSAQNVGKFAICNNCVPTGSGAPVCTQNNYVHWGNEDEQGNCNDRTTVISGACSEGTIDSPLGSGEVGSLFLGRDMVREAYETLFSTNRRLIATKMRSQAR